MQNYKIIKDGQEITSDKFSGGLNDLIQNICSQEHYKKLVLSAVSCNNKTFIGTDIDSLLSENISCETDLVLEFKSKYELLCESVNSIPTYLNYLCQLARDLTNLIQEGQALSASEKSIELIDIIDLFFQLTEEITNGFSNGEKAQNARLAHQQQGKVLISILSSMVDAKKTGNDSMLSDLIEFELIPNIELWEKNVLGLFTECLKEFET